MSGKQVEDKWSRDSWILGGIVAAIVVAFVGISLVYVKGIFDRSAESKARDQFITCVRNWSDAYSRRADLLQQLSTERTNALDTYIRAERDFLRRLAAHQSQGDSRGAFERLLAESDAYARASGAYSHAVKKHPVPASPQFVCSHGKEGVAPGHIREGLNARPSAPTVSPAASQPPVPGHASVRPTTTVRTVSAPSTRSATARTRTEPTAPTRTRTVTKTAHPRPPASTSRGLAPGLLCGTLGLPLCPTETP